MARFQEVIEGITDMLQDAQAGQRSAQESELQSSMKEISQPLQDKSKHTESSNLFIITKARIELKELDIVKVIKERSHNARLAAETILKRAGWSMT